MLSLSLSSVSLAAAGLLTASLALPKPPAPWQPPQQLPVEQVFPESSFAVVRFAGLEACKKASSKLGVLKLGEQVLERAGEQFLERAIGKELELDQALRHMRQWFEKAGVDPSALRKVLQKPVALGIGRPTVFGEAIVPSMAIAIDVSGAKKQAEDMMQVFEQHMRQHGPAVTVKTERINGHPFQVMRSRRESGTILYGFVDDCLLVSCSIGYAKECVATMAGERPSLARNRAFRHARSQLPADPLFDAYVNFEPVLGLAKPLLPYEAEGIGNAIGIRSLNGLYIATAPSGRNSIEVIHVGIEGPKSGLIKSIFGKPSSFRAARWCPPETLLFATASLNMAGVERAMKELVEALPTEVGRELQREIDREVVREIRRELRHINVELEDFTRLLGFFGPEVSFMVTQPGTREIVPEITAFVEVSDAERAKTALLEMLKRVGLEVKTTRYQGSDLHYCSLYRQEIPLSPSFTFRDGMMIASTQLRTLKTAVKRSTRPEESLATDELFRAARRSAGSASVFVNVRLGSTIAQSWNLVLPFVQSMLASEADIEIDEEVLPSVEEIKEAIGDLLLTLSVDDHGITLKASQPLGFGMFLALAGTVCDWTLGKIKVKRRVL